MDEEELNGINTEKRKQFDQLCKGVNADTYNCHWNWKNIGDNIGRIMIYDNYKGEDIVSIWEETRGQAQLLQDEWMFRPNEFLAIGITRQGIIRVGNGVYALAWIGKDGLFESIYFDQQDENKTFEDLNELSLPSEQSTLDELKELDALDGWELIE
jgi:hypothetical protein